MASLGFTPYIVSITLMDFSPRADHMPLTWRVFKVEV
jgi:hypothetical protein